MNVYEEAHNLSRAIKECEEYKQYKQALDKIKEKPELDEMIQDFTKKQIEMQTKQAMGEEVDSDMAESIQKLSAIVMSDPAAADFIQTQVRFAIMIQDVYKIIAETVELK